ncbi:MAG: protein arginine kinase [Eubacteriales bacterium]|nr:protein arginine kinase [Eubacteriales bacterium]
MKWYENPDIDNNIIISSRIRLARNIKENPIYKFLNRENAREITEKVKNAIFNGISNGDKYFQFIDMEKVSDLEKIAMIENHLISLDFLNNDLPKGLILENGKELSIMINEEDHIRIQSIEFGNNIEKAFKTANKIDDLIEEKIDYAFDEDFGYLTSCLTNVGTGMRASFMIHIPMLEKYNQINDIAQSISKFGMTIRGIYGEGSQALGGIYQISNQATLGKTEEELIANIKNITLQIIEKEKFLREKIKNESNIDLIDKIYRSYGILKNCKKISNDEALNHLSNIWLGMYYKILNKDLSKTNIYNIMMMIQPANLIKKFNKLDEKEQFEIYRAKLINDIL